MKKKGGSVIVAVDPGINNLGWCVCTMQGRPIEWGLETSTLDDLKTPENIRAFKQNMRFMLDRINSFAKERKKRIEFIMERYMPRGMRRGNQTERINIIIGYLLAKVKYANVYLVPASSWKNRRERVYIHLDNKTIPEHITDTYTMSLYLLERIMGRVNEKQVRKLLKQVDKTDFGWKKVKGVWTSPTAL
ncbi:MAG: hypothetical protein K2N48_10485 [Muribaculaceae bacterium]|nr:hypothetical protein [Muribaculaceae bacterium]